MTCPRQRLVSSGGSLAVDTGQGHITLLQGFSIDQFSLTNDMVDVHGVGAWPRRVITGTHVEFSLRSQGQVRFLTPEEAEGLFFDPATASVDELLRLAYAKIDARAQREA